jgi:hypothetical protein
MSERLLEYLSVLLSSMFKFIFGPIQGVAYGLGWLETAALTASGMMLSVFFFTYFGRFLKQRFFKREKLFTPKIICPKFAEIMPPQNWYGQS